MELVDRKSFVVNGVIQVVAGAVSFVLTIAGYFLSLTVHNAAGIGLGGGILFIAAGVCAICTGVKRSFFCVVATLTLSVINAIVGLINFVIYYPFFHLYRYEYHCWWPSWSQRVDNCLDWKYRVIVSLSVVLLVAAFAQLVAAVWAIVVASRAIHYRNRKGASSSTSSDFANRHAKTSSIMANSVAQATTSVVSTIVGVVILFVVAYGVQSGKNDQRFLGFQTMGSSLWVGPVFLLAAFLGFRSARFGENSSLVGFLCLNVLNMFLALFGELTGAALALSDRYYGMQTCDMDEYYPRNCHYRFYPPLVALNGVLVIAAVAHFAFAVWGLVAAAVVLHRDKTCARCCGCCCPPLDEAATGGRGGGGGEGRRGGGGRGGGEGGSSAAPTMTEIRYVVAYSPTAAIQPTSGAATTTGNIVLVPMNEYRTPTHETHPPPPPPTHETHPSVH